MQITIGTHDVTLKTAAGDVSTKPIATAMASNRASDAMNRIPHGYMPTVCLAVARALPDRMGASIIGGGAAAVNRRRTAFAEQR